MERSLQQQFANIRASSTKQSASDEKFHADRKLFAAAVGVPELFSFIDQFGVYAGDQTIASRLVSYEVVKSTVDVPGHIAEFGVWHGANLLFMAKVLRLLSPSTTKLVFGFDNFSGLPSAIAKDGDIALTAAGRSKGNEHVLRAAVELCGVSQSVHLVKGVATHTIPAFEAEFPEAMVSLGWVDFDLYEPCKAALTFLKSRKAIGGVIVFDEAISSVWPGEGTAMLEFLNESGQRFSMHANTIGRQPVMWLTRLS